jgi:hypothetical protein
MLVNCDVDGDLSIGLEVVSGTTTFTPKYPGADEFWWFKIVKIQQKAPYLVANKGALVSGGAFEFDLDGHCFPEIYSTDEVLCGRWIDGKPIYKKTIDCGYLPDTAKKTINVNIPDLQVIIKMEGFYYGEGLWGPLPYPYLTSLNDGVIVWLNAGQNLNIQTMSNRSSQYAYVTLYYLKTAD